MNLRQSIKPGTLVSFHQQNERVTGTVWAIGHYREPFELPQHYILYVKTNDTFHELVEGVREWQVVGHDSTFVPPTKEELVQLLIAQIKDLPMHERNLWMIQRFRTQFPYESKAYHTLLDQVWQKAFLLTTSIEEVLDIKEERLPLPVHVQAFLRTEFLSLDPDGRWDAFHKLHWNAERILGVEDFSIWEVDEKGFPLSRNIGFFYNQKAQFYHPIIQHVIQTTDNPDLLIKMAELNGFKLTQMIKGQQLSLLDIDYES